MLRRLAITSFFLLVVWLVCLLPVAAIVHWLFEFSWVYMLPASILLTVVYAFGSLQLLRNGPDWLAFVSMQFMGVCSVGWLVVITGLFIEFFIPGFNPVVPVVIVWTALAAFGIYNAFSVTTVFHKISDYRIEQPVRVIQLTDVHIGSRRANFLERVVNMTKELTPDVTVITGDLIDLSRVEATDLQALSRLRCPVLMSTGNHERYIDFEKALAAVESHGVTVLRDTSTIQNGITFIGMDDREATGELESTLQSILVEKSRTAAKVPSENYTIVLYHKPCLLYTSPSPRDRTRSRMPSSA